MQKGNPRQEPLKKGCLFFNITFFLHTLENLPKEFNVFLEF